MPSWGNTDSIYDKPHWPKTRQVHMKTSSMVTVNAQTSSSNSLYFNPTDVTTAGIVAGSFYSPTANVGISGEAGFLISNNVVNLVAGGQVRFANNFYGAVANGQLTGSTIQFDQAISYQSNERSNTYNQDTVLVTTTRLANAVFANSTVYSSSALANSGSAAAHTGWVNVVTGTGGRQGRVQTEVLIALANASATIAYSANTSNVATYYNSL